MLLVRARAEGRLGLELHPTYRWSIALNALSDILALGFVGYHYVQVIEPQNIAECALDIWHFPESPALTS